MSITPSNLELKKNIIPYFQLVMTSSNTVEVSAFCHERFCITVKMGEYWKLPPKLSSVWHSEVHQQVLCTSLPLLLQLPLSVSAHYHTVVLVGCVCCLVQTMFTLFLLLPYWWHHRTCLIFLKLQCCTATSGAMGVFIYAVRDSVPKVTLNYKFNL